MKHPTILVAAAILACFPASYAGAVASGVTITIEGAGAGAVVFDGTVHAKHSCAECHEGRGPFSIPWFNKKKGADVMTMKAMEEGWSCGHCHVVDMKDTLSCEKCHHK